MLRDARAWLVVLQDARLERSDGVDHRAARRYMA
jgi:hypothetical protein